MLKTQYIMKDRIKKIRDYYCEGNNLKFAQDLGVAPQFASNLCNGVRHPGAATLKKIKQIYPEINQAWLLTGEGEMLKGVQTATENSAPVYQNSGNGGNNVTQTAGAPSSTIDKLIEEMRAQREMSAQQIERLLTIIENMTKPNRNNTNE